MSNKKSNESSREEIRSDERRSDERRSDERDSRPIVETYQNTLAGGVDTIRWWAHEKILIGGSILSREDWQHLKAFYKVEGVLSVEAERNDANKGIDGPYVHLPAPDDGLPKPAEWWAAGLVFMAGYFRNGKHGGPLYIHSQSGLGRAPAMAYLCMRAIFRMSVTESIQMIRVTLPDYGKAPSHVAYLRSAEDTLALLGEVFEPRM